MIGRCHLPTAAWADRQPALEADESRHIVTVLRARAGDRVGLFDGFGLQGEAEIVRVDPRCVELRILRTRTLPPPATAVTLALALLREQKMDWAVQKAVEIGVSRICPLAAERCVAQIPASRVEDKRARWMRIAVQAAKQSGADRLPEIAPPLRVRDWASGASGPRTLVGSLRPGAKPLNEVLDVLLDPRPASIAVAIGPEGDWTNDELDALCASGAVESDFGARVLRAETAALFALSVLRYRLQPLNPEGQTDA